MQTKINTKKIILLAAFMSAAASFALYLPSLGFEFVNWDDHLYVYENPDIREFDIVWAFTAVVASTWIPLTQLSFFLDYAIWGLDPFGYHLTNTVLHAANSFLVASLAAKLGARGGLGARAVFVMALSAGLLFGLHPLRVESVAWVSERKDVLNALFFLLGLHAYLSYAASRKASSYMLTLLFFVLSLLSKPMTVTMPLVLLILDYYPLDRAARDGWRRLIIEKSPFLALSLAAGLMGIWSQEAGASIVPVAELPLAGRIHIAARGYLFYVYKLLFPAALAPFYPRELAAGPNFLSLLYIAALSAITALAFYLRKWSKAYLSAWAYFVITLLPVIGLLQVGSQAAADRYTYLPGISLAMLVAAGAGMVVMKRRKAFLPALAAVAVISALLSFLTFRQAAVWKDPISLWNRQITLFPQHSYGYMYRGGALINAGRYGEGLADLTVVVDMHGEEKIAYKARGTAYAVAGQYDNAIEDFLKAVELDPYDSSTHIELGKAYMHLGDNRNSYLSMKKADRLGDPAALGFLKDLETWEAGPGE